MLIKFMLWCLTTFSKSQLIFYNNLSPSPSVYQLHHENDCITSGDRPPLWWHSPPGENNDQRVLEKLKFYKRFTGKVQNISQDEPNWCQLPPWFKTVMMNPRILRIWIERKTTLKSFSLLGDFAVTLTATRRPVADSALYVWKDKAVTECW